MHAPIISTRTTNVELAKQQQTLLAQTLLRLSRCNSQPGPIHFDVVIRQEPQSTDTNHYFVSVKCSTAHSSYITIATASRFEKAVKQVYVALKSQLQETARQQQRRRRSESIWRHDLLWA